MNRPTQDSAADQTIVVDSDAAQAQAAFLQGVALHQRGQLAQAQAFYQQALNLQAKHAHALHLSGVIAYQSKRPQQAVDLINRAIELDPKVASYYSNRGLALHDLARFDEALSNHDQATKINPADAVYHNNRGITLQALQRLDEALASYDQATRLKPDYAVPYLNRGNALRDIGRLEAALASYDHALALNPDYAEAHSNRGLALQDLKRLDEALESYARALKIRPDYATAYMNRGKALQELKRLDEALNCYDHAIKLNPGFVDAHSNRASVLTQLKRHAEAVQSLTRLVELAPDYDFAHGSLLHAKMTCCDWSGLAELHETVRGDIEARRKSAEPFGYQGISDSEQSLRACAEIYAAGKYPKSTVRMNHTKRPRHGKIRIGYLAGEFRHQATSILMASLFELHEKGRLEVFAFDNGWDDGSKIRARLVQAFDQIIDITKMSDLAAASLISDMEIDILVHLNGYFGAARHGVFSYKPSPIQVNYLGFPGTIGSDAIDYLIADRIVIPEASRQHYVEKIVYLPDSYQANDPQRVIANTSYSREALELPERGFVFCCFNNNYKITPATFDGWMRILRQVPGSVLWLLQDNATAAANLRQAAEARGVAAARLIFAKRMPLEEHLARHRAADLFIDTLPYNAHTTASDALWAGLPVLTCVGQTFPGRVGASLLNALKLPELVTTNQAEYEALAVQLATQPERLDQIRQKLARNRLTTSLFDAERFTQNIETAYTAMIERYQADLPPEHICLGNH